MKKRTWKLAGMLLVFALTVPALSGCSIGNTEIKFVAGQLRNHKTIFRINDYKCDIGYAKLYLCNYRNLYGEVYGTDLWEQYDADLEDYVKNVTIQELTHIACMDILAKRQNMKLTADEKQQAAQVAKEYYQSLTEEERTFLNMHESDVRAAYEDYALAEKLYRELTQGTEEEISDDEARVIRVQQIFVKDQKTLRTVEQSLANGDDFAAVAGAYSQSKEVERTVARGVYPKAVEDVAFDLENNACSDAVEADGGYYIIRCLNKYEKDLTEENKEKIRLKRKKERFETDYHNFVKNSTFRLNEDLWKSVTLKDVQGIKTDSFFALYDQYFGTGESTQES